MAIFKIVDPNVKEGLRITTKEGMTVQTYELVFNQLVKFMVMKIDAITAGLYSSNNSPGTKWYKILTKNTRDLFLEDKELYKTIVYVNSSFVTDVLGRQWKSNSQVYSAGANIRKTASAKDNSNLLKASFYGLVGKFVSTYKNNEGEWIYTDTKSYIFSKLALQQDGGTNPDSGTENNDQQNPLESNKFKIGVGLIITTIGGLIWAFSGNNNKKNNVKK